MTRPQAYFINGGAGRVIASIPAFEKLAETNKDFIIVCEGGSDMYRGHPVLDQRAYDNWHKGIFVDHLKHRELISPEPYRVWEYYNQMCSLAQAFDIAINNKGIRKLNAPTINLNKLEIAEAYKFMQEVKARSGFEKTVVIQPFGRGVMANHGMIVDPSSRSFAQTDLIDIVNSLKKEYGVIVMSEFGNIAGIEAATPRIPNIRIWAAIIELSDYFLGCDSVGQHIARSLEKPSTVVTGSTFPINVSYPDCSNFTIIDIGEQQRMYSPIRISQEDAIERNNDACMEMSDEHKRQILKSIKNKLGKSVKSTVKFPESTNPQIEHTNTHNHVHDHGAAPVNNNFKLTPLSQEISGMSPSSSNNFPKLISGPNLS